MTNPFQYLLRRSHRTTSLLYFRCSQAKVLSTFQRSIGLLGGLPLGGFRFGHDRRDIMGVIPRCLIRFLNARESYPLSPCIASGRFFGLPGLPVRISIWSISGSTCSLSLSAAPVEITERGRPLLSTRAWSVTPLPLKPYWTPSPPPLPAANEPSTDDRVQSIRPSSWACPIRRALIFAHVPSVSHVPNQRCDVERVPKPLPPGTSIHPGSCNKDPEYGVENIPEGCMGTTFFPVLWLFWEKGGHYYPLGICQTSEFACHLVPPY